MQCTSRVVEKKFRSEKKIESFFLSLNWKEFGQHQRNYRVGFTVTAKNSIKVNTNRQDKAHFFSILLSTASAFASFPFCSDYVHLTALSNF